VICAAQAVFRKERPRRVLEHATGPTPSTLIIRAREDKEEER
jgi:hypothetical protein